MHFGVKSLKMQLFHFDKSDENCVIRVVTGQGKVRENQGQGKVKEF